MVLPASDVPPRRAIQELLRAAWIGPTLYAMASLGIADRLAAGPRTIDDLAAASGTHPPTLARFLRTLSAIGMCEFDDHGLVHLTERGQFLRSDRPDTIQTYILSIHAPHVERAWDGLADAVRTGRPSFPETHGMDFWEYLSRHPDDQALFDTAMSTGADRRAHALLTTQDLSEIGTLVDVGGGNGTLLAAALAAHPHLNGVLFDRAEALTDAKAVLARAGVLDRCELVAGDFFTSVPEGGDAYVLALVVHDWPDPEAVDILRSCHRAMRPGARIWLVEGVLRSDDAYDSQKLLDMLMLVLFGAQERTFEEYEALLTNAGFGDVRLFPSPAGPSVIEGVRSQA